ncbi:apolipoprotein N-acyltransferase [Nocardioides marmorisolisilvae]|uniref:CN hydrolase domain-containing protein n=1 Tax=Nocardioides marmorisolisilvae TaxID=1542737 RepID=A0A3N0DZ79_9ACTN|nr:nitrilase-related carbon-nitrogen hydrolase [Nocardioides marmorisolisilvae]RNL80914.1 hypothetical protein EFL95_00550 [Nocardioides marmorisolisilvae]
MISGSARRIAEGIGLSVLSAVALVLASSSYGVWPLVFVAFVPLVVAQNRVLPARWSGLALGVAVGGYLVWILWDTFLPGQRWIFAVLVPGLIGGGWFSRLCLDRTGRRHVWSDPVVWTAVLFVLALTPIASWVDPAYALYHQAWLIQPISLVGIAGLNLVVMLVNYALAGLVVSAGRTKVVAAVSVAAAAAAWVGSSALMLAHHDDGPVVRVAVVQPGITDLRSPAGDTSRRADLRRTLTGLEAATVRAQAKGAQLVVWPEEVLRYVTLDESFDAELQALARSTGTLIVTGFTEDHERFNRALLVGPGGRMLTYDKRHPVTFQGDHSVGGPVRVADTELGRIAPIICYDLDYPETARQAVRTGAQLLAVPSWDWSGIAEQHYAHLVFRSVENGVPAAKADTAWDSVIVDSDGRIRARHISTGGDTALLVADVHLGTGATFYTRHGDLLGWAVVVVAGLWGAYATAAIARRRRA